MKLLLSFVYIPPNTHKNIYIKYCELVESIILGHFIVHILIIGDFNVSGFSSTDYTLIKDPNSNVIISSFINYLNLKQVNNIYNFGNDILDLILTNNRIECILLGCSLTPSIDSYHPL